MGDFLKFSYRELFKKHVKKLIFSGFWSKQPKKTVKIGYCYINHAKVLLFTPYFWKKICIFCWILQKLVKDRQTKNIS
jgi:hypothetical protein